LEYSAFQQNFRALAKLLTVLSLWVRLSIVLVVFTDIRAQARAIKVQNLIIVLIIILYSFFLTGNLTVLYTRFELSLVPIFLIIIGWGYQPERLKAGISLIFYTLTASLPLIAFLFFL
jgi:NADH-ubiquinone oxidoreductase chain 4